MGMMECIAFRYKQSNSIDTYDNNVDSRESQDLDIAEEVVIESINK